MPPKLQLNVDIMASQSLRPGDVPNQNTLYAPSIEIMPGGALKLFKSMQAYEFNPLGMTRGNGGGGNGGDAPLAAGVGAMQRSYKISEQDVRVIRTLGQGASALVQKVFIPKESRFAAIKKISILEREKRHQLMNDIKALCNAPNVPGLIRFFGAYHAADKGQIAVALEYMDGGSLADVLAKVGRIPEPILADIAAQIIPPLDFMHSHHMVHRDIKPANILMATNGDAKVSDFGISAFIDNTIAQCHTFLGTVTYMSPERIDGKPYSFPADIWAVGLTLLECATGKYPYDASGGTMALMLQLLEDECPLPPQDDDDGDDDDENRQMNNNNNSLRNSKQQQQQPCKLSPEFRDFIQRCMYKDPMKRPSAADLMRHPFISRRQPADVRAFMSCMYNEEEKLADAVTIAATRFYNNLAWNWKDSDSIAAYYAPDAVFTFHGQKYKGRFTIASHFHQMMRQVGQMVTSVVFNIVELSHQPLAGSKDQAVVQTTVEIVADESGNSSSSSGGGGREEGSMGMHMGWRGSGNGGRQGDDDGTTNGRVLGKFSDTFIMTMSSYDNALPGTGYTFNNQIFRWIVALQPPKRRPGMGGGMGSGGGGGNAQKCRVQ